MEKQKFFDKAFEIPSEFREDFCFWNDQNVVFIKNAFFEKFETRLNAKTFKAAFCIVLNESE